MNELSERPHPQDIYLMSLVEMLRTKYVDVSVNRQRRNIVFIYYLNIPFKRMGESMKFRKELPISRLQIEKCHAEGVVPKKLRDLLKD